VWHRPSQKCKKGCLPTAKDSKYRSSNNNRKFQTHYREASVLRGDRSEVGMSKEKSSPTNGTFFVMKDLLVLFRCVVW